MAKSTNITIEKRDFSRNPRQLRSEGLIPGTVYGHGYENVSVQVDAKAFVSAFKGDKTSILDLKCGNETYSTLVKKVQGESTSDKILNIEFYRVNTSEKLKVRVPIEFVGESLAIKLGGVLLHPVSEIEVECLPKDIPHTINVDLAKLENIDDSITVGDLDFPAGVTTTEAPDNLIARANAPASGVEAAAEAAPEVAELAKS